MGSTSSSIITGSGRGNTWTSDDKFPQWRTAWKGEYAWSISLLKTVSNTRHQRFIENRNIRKTRLYFLFPPPSESYPNIACTLFMQSAPSTVNICPSPPLRRRSSSKLFMVSLICNCTNTATGVWARTSRGCLRTLSCTIEFCHVTHK